LLRLRLVRTGCTNKQTFRIVVADHHKAVKKKFVETLGYYLPTQDPKVLEFNEERVKYWISKGAKPTDTTASLFKNQGIDGMDAFIEPRDKKRKKKAEIKAEAKGEGKEKKEGGEAPKEEAPKEEAKKEEAPKEENKEEKPAEEAAPKEEAKAETPKEEPKKEDAPKEEAKEEAPAEESK